MRLKLTLKERGKPARDIQVTVDVTATVQELASHLRRADPSRADPEDSGDPRVTLRVEYPGQLHAHQLSPLLSVHESGLRSGCTIELVPVGERSLGDDSSEPAGALQVVAGPDAGRRFVVTAGVNIIGRDPAADIQLTDGLASRRHASITAGETAEITDLNSANGIEVDGRAAARAVLTPRSRIRIGDDELRWLPAAGALSAPEVAWSVGNGPMIDGKRGATSAGDSSFTRSPRVEPVYRGTEFALPQPPGTIDRARFPLLAMFAPLGMGVALFAVTHQVISLLFIALSPIIMIGTWVDNRIQNRRKQRDATDRFGSSLDSAQRALTTERERERQARIAESPSTSDVLGAIHIRSPALWTRRPEHTTFLEVRFGLGTLPSRNTVTLPARSNSTASDWDELTTTADQFAELDGVPVIDNFERAGAIGVAGSSIIATDIARAIVLQLAGLHSPADLVIAAFGAENLSDEWSWLKWLPHVDSPHSPLQRGCLASDFNSANVLMAELEDLIESRRAAGAGKGTFVRGRLDEGLRFDADHGASVDRLPATPAVVSIVAPADAVDRARLVAIAENGPDFGVFTLWVARDAAALPVVCRTFVDVDAFGRATVGHVRTGRRVPLTAIEGLDVMSAQQAARLLAPIEDSGAQVLDESDLPRRVALLDLFSDPVAGEADAVIRRWRKNDSITQHWSPGAQREPGGICALVGQSAGGALQLDLRSHGPHALVGGTTGSGKSEFLQSWILALATEYSSDRLNFLLVDYKGGSAFAECVDLPHSVGLVTDLTPRLVNRALTSLKAELRYREELLNRTGAKDLETLESRSDPDAPPSLVIVIDEFAALASEVPDFVAGVIDIAQRGRSLGLHLVMATQRPAGVITQSLRANTNLRVALRVADEADSTDVLGIAAAAYFDPGTPGRAAAKLGPGRVIDFQSAFAGGWTNEASAQSEIAVTELAFGHGAAWAQPGAARPHTGPRDSERLVSVITHAAERCALQTPRRPWLDELPDALDLDTLPAADGSSIPIGLADEPEAQRQVPFVLSPDRDGNVAAVGTGGSGKTTLLRSIAFAASRSADAHPIWIYGLDFAGGALRQLEQLPTVGSIIAGDDHERLGRLVRWLETVVEDRAERFGAVSAASLTDFRRITGKPESRILILVDGMGAFRTDYEFRASDSLFDEFVKLISRGRQLGVSFILTADRPGAIPTTIQANVQATIVLRLAGEGEYSAAGLSADALDGAPPGRAVCDGQEFQIGAPGGGRDATHHVERIALLATTLESRVNAAPPVARLPTLIGSDALPSTHDGRAVLGLGHETLSPVTVALKGIFVVTGPLGSGRSTAMRTLIRNARKARPAAEFYLLAGRRGELAEAENWVEASASPDSADELAGRLAARLEASIAERVKHVVIVIEGVGDFDGLAADTAVARLIGVARRTGASVIAETDTVTGASAWAITGQLKAARSGIVLQPEEGDGMSLFRVQFPRIRRSEFPLGRGILVRDGRMERVQVAHTGPGSGPC
ncbi:FHA domain-containing protein [Diaminobutyricibacter tongyongensis]|uniref:FHA domain-containing protein n=1 Tax=Leifsonia tongyongensis TaxID=1268043 RepID=A0A6L9XX68_9MICO|nr:FtsK/SpoIIIE domain-containing protein [Diaminobutyricibacter tongyongensis]NEN06019.1 FHA domain-containing protein [Diaminobutyricibacter tongyongensis]